MVKQWMRRRAGFARVGEVGSVMPLVALWMAALVLTAMALVAGASAAVDRARAQAAADAVALAGAAEGREAAQVVASMNDGVIWSYVERTPSAGVGNGLGRPGRSAHVAVVVTVVVEVEGVTATAAAERFLAPVGFLSPP